MATSEQAGERSSDPLKVMLDTSAYAQAVTHTTAWISKGTSQWGPQQWQVGWLARVQRDFSDPRDRLFSPEVAALAALAAAAQTGVLEFYETVELRAERWGQPAGRFFGYGLLVGAFH